MNNKGFDLKHLHKFYKFELLECDQSKYFNQNKLYRGNYKFFEKEHLPFITTCIQYHDQKTIEIRFTLFEILIKQYAFYELINDMEMNRDMFNNLALEISEGTDYVYTFSEIIGIIDSVYDKVVSFMNDEIEDKPFETYLSLNTDVIEDLPTLIHFFIKHKMYYIKENDNGHKDLFFGSYIKDSRQHKQLEFDLNSIKKRNAFTKHFKNNINTIIDIMQYAKITNYPNCNRSELSFGDILIMAEKIFKTFKFNDEIIKANQIIHNPNALYPFYFIYNNIKDHIENIKKYEPSRNEIEFCDNDLHAFDKLINRAEKHKKRKLLSLENDINIIQKYINNKYYVDNKNQKINVQNKLHLLIILYQKQKRDYNNFYQLIKTVLYNKTIFKTMVKLNDLSDLLIKEFECFYDIQFNTIKLYKTKSKKLNNNRELNLILLNRNIQSIHTKLYELKIKSLEILDKLDDIYQEILNTSQTTFANIPYQYQSNINDYSDFDFDNFF